MPEESQLQVARILAMASWINDNPGHTVRQIAQHFGRTSRQVRRDIEYMGEIGDSMLDRSYGIDWQLYDEQEILVMRGSTLPSLPSFTPAEAATLLVALRALSPHLREVEKDALLTAAAKLSRLAQEQATSSSEDREIIRLLGEEPVLAKSTEGDMVAQLREAIAQRLEVTFTYQTGQIHAPRHVFPLGLRRLVDAWILDAWDPKREVHRSYNVTHIDSLQIGGRRPQVAIPDAEAPQSLTLTVTQGARCLCEDYECTLLKEDADTVTLSLPVWNEAWVLALLCDISADIIECPASWRLRMATYATQALKNWDHFQEMRSGE